MVAFPAAELTCGAASLRVARKAKLATCDNISSFPSLLAPRGTPHLDLFLFSHALTFLEFTIAWPSDRFFQFQGIPRVFLARITPCCLSPISVLQPHLPPWRIHGAISVANA